MNFNSLIEKITIDFIHYWNQRDLDRLASFLANCMMVRSPKMYQIFPDLTDGEVVEKSAILQHWQNLNKQRFFNLQLVSYSGSAKMIHCAVTDVHSDQRFIATFKMDEYGKFTEIIIEEDQA